MLSCKNGLIADFLEPETTQSLSLSDAKKWFEESYLTSFSKAKQNPALKHSRIANWDKAKEFLLKGEQKCVLVPIRYEDENKPSFATWTEETAFREKLLNYYALPIIEVLIIYKDERGNNQAYLSQIAYDRYQVVKDSIDFEKFNGWILKATWDDEVLEGEKFENGLKKLQIERESKARTAECYWYESGGYYTSSGQSCGVNCYEFTITYHKQYSVYCTYWDGGAPPMPVQIPFPPEEGGGGGPIYIPETTNYNLKNAVCNASGWDRQNLVNSMGNALNATGLGASVTGWSFSKAEAILRAAGASIDDFRPLVTGSRNFGIAGGVLGGMRGVVGLFDGSISDHDALDIIGGVIGVGLALSPAGWIPVAVGGAVTLGIAIYEANNEPISDTVRNFV